MKRKFGITLEQYDSILESQGGVCFVCQEPPNGQHLDVDHNHGTGEVRGLLCNNCNRGIGHLQEDPLLMVRAITYLGSKPAALVESNDTGEE